MEKLTVKYMSPARSEELMLIIILLRALDLKVPLLLRSIMIYIAEEESLSSLSSLEPE
jgi:hypothetical protein